jgi:WD40 repeat protein/Flp pilus assembly protein TadD
MYKSVGFSKRRKTRFAGVISLPVLLSIQAFAQVPNGPTGAEQQAADFLESGEARKAVAVVAKAVREKPGDRVLGSMLYTLLRDRLWHLPHCKPIDLGSPVRVVVFSSQSRWLAAGTEGGGIKVTAINPEDSRSFDFQTEGEVLGLAFSSDEQRLAIVGSRSGLVVRDIEKGTATLEPAKPKSPATAFAASLDGRFIAIGCEDGSGQIIEIGTTLVTPFKHAKRINALSFSRDGERLASASADRTVRVWKCPMGQALGPGISHNGNVLSVDFSYDGRYVLSAGADKTARLSDAVSSRPVMKPMKCGAVVRKVEVSPDGSRFFAMLDDGSITFWDMLTGARQDAVVREDGRFTDAAWSPGGLRLITGSELPHAAFWSAQDGTQVGEVLPHERTVHAVAFSPDWKLAATGSADGTARLWRANGGKPMPTVRHHFARVRTAFYTPSGDMLISASEDQTALRWKSGQLSPSGNALAHAAQVVCAVPSNDETRVLTASEDGSAQLWDMETGQKLGAPFAHPEPVTWVEFHPDAKHCVTTSGSRAFVWELDGDHSKPVATLEAPGGQLLCARFSLDGKWLITTSDQGFVRRWDAENWKVIDPPIASRGAPMRCVRFSPDGTRIVVIGDDLQAVVYDAVTWKPIGRPILLPGIGYSAAMTQDNRFLIATGFLLNGVKYFDLNTGRPLGEGYNIEAQATCVDYLLSDKVVVLATDDGTVRSIDSPFVEQDTPAWMPDFAQKVVGLEQTGPDAFAPVASDITELRRFLGAGARAKNADFPRLARWLVTTGNLRNGMPRFTSTIAAHIERRVEERSADALYECYDAAPGDPLVLAGLSLFTPNRRHSEFLADYVLSRPDADALAQTYVAAALINAGRSEEAQAIMAKALAAAPDDQRVLRRQAKINAKIMNYELAAAEFNRILEVQPDDVETMRSYAWALYNMGSPGTALTYFRRAASIGGGTDPDIIAGICLTAKAWGMDEEAMASYRRLVQIDAAWANPAYLARLPGWSSREIQALDRVRASIQKR